jgi:hypothetical protein
MTSRFLVLLLTLLCVAAPAAAAPPIATIVEGDSVVVRDATRLALAEGVRLAPDDLIQTTDKTKLLRIEFDDGLMLLVAPESRLWLAPRFGSERSSSSRSARIYLMAGAIKLTAKADSGPISTPVATPIFDVISAGRDTVVTVNGAKGAVFAESGDARIVERNKGKGGSTQAGPAQTLKGGEFYNRPGADKGTIGPRPDADFIKRLPRAFLDTLPSRVALFTARDVPAKPVGEFSYDDAQPWVDSEPSMRPAFVTRWKPLATQPAFRKSLAADMRAHPEWDRILYPEKYLPKPASAASDGAYGTSGVPQPR